MSLTALAAPRAVPRKNALLAALLALAAPASASPLAVEKPEDEPPVGWSIAAGAAVALVPLAVAGALSWQGSDGDRTAAIYVMQTGLLLAPIVSHLVGREWGRAAIFGVVPSLAILAMALENRAAGFAIVHDQGYTESRTVFVTALAVSFFSSWVGLLDSLLVGERARSRLSLVPSLGPSQIGLAVGGVL